MIWLEIKLLIKFSKISKNSQQSDLETVTNENDKEISNERYTSPEEREDIFWSEIKIV